VDRRAGLDDVEKGKFLTLQGLEPRPLGREHGLDDQKCGVQFPAGETVLPITVSRQAVRPTDPPV
jgi:hypothetical protein